jgi:hypothetical protein
MVKVLMQPSLKSVRMKDAADPDNCWQNLIEQDDDAAA